LPAAGRGATNATVKTTISIIILTQNSLGVLSRLLDRLLPQLSAPEHELVFLDSESSDGTVPYILSLPFASKKVVNVEQGTFSHSRTRMWGADNCQSDLIVFFTDDIVPCGDNFLAELVAPVASGIASASYGVSLINPASGDPLRARRYNGWFLSHPDLVEPLTEREWSALPPAERRKRCNFDDCAACYRREVLQAIRFPDLPYGEDIGIAKRLITAKHSIALAKGATFFHWHNVSYRYFLKRMCIDQIVIKDLFDLSYLSTKAAVTLRIIMQIGLYSLLAFTLPKIPFPMRFYWLAYSLKFICADNVGKYIGGLESEHVNRIDLIDVYLLRLKERYYDEIIKHSLKRDVVKSDLPNVSRPKKGSLQP